MTGPDTDTVAWLLGIEYDPDTPPSAHDDPALRVLDNFVRSARIDGRHLTRAEIERWLACTRADIDAYTELCDAGAAVVWP